MRKLYSILSGALSLLYILTPNMSINYEAMCCKQKIITYRPLKLIASDAVENFISSYDVSVFENEQDVDLKLANFNSLFSNLLDAVAPKKLSTFKQSPVPWMSADLCALKKERDVCYRAARRHNSSCLFIRCIDLRRKFKRELLPVKDAYLESKFAV